MAFSPSGAIAGSVTTGFTTPTYTWSADTAPAANAKQFAVTNIGGTQTGVETSTAADSPWTCALFKPTLKAGPQITNSGNLSGNPRNKWTMVFRKGMLPSSASSQHSTAIITTHWDFPAGAESNDAAEVNACVGSFIGLLANQANGLADTFRTGIM